MRLDQIPADAPELSFENSVYSIRIAGATTSLRPQVFLPLQDAVEDVPEYVVRWDNFVRLAAEYGLYLLYRKAFHEVFEGFHEFMPLLQRMNVVDANGETEIDEDQWEAANIYTAFAMEKR